MILVEAADVVRAGDRMRVAAVLLESWNTEPSPLVEVIRVQVEPDGSKLLTLQTIPGHTSTATLSPLAPPPFYDPETADTDLDASDDMA